MRDCKILPKRQSVQKSEAERKWKKEKEKEKVTFNGEICVICHFILMSKSSCKCHSWRSKESKPATF